jgi:hypothetical protein
MLGIDSKTLRNWLRHAQLHFVAHPTDARVKCLTPEQVQQLATRHARPIAPLAAASAALRQEATPLASTLWPSSSSQPNETRLADAPAACSEEARLQTAVCGLETKVMALQEQVAQLTLNSFASASRRYERRLSSLEALLSQNTPLLPIKAEEGPVVALHREHPFQRTLQPGELRARSRVLPRVELGAAGSYVLICPARWGAGFRSRFAGMV